MLQLVTVGSQQLLHLLHAFRAYMYLEVRHLGRQGTSTLERRALMVLVGRWPTDSGAAGRRRGWPQNDAFAHPLPCAVRRPGTS